MELIDIFSKLISLLLVVGLLGTIPFFIELTRQILQEYSDDELLAILGGFPVLIFTAIGFLFLVKAVLVVYLV